MNQGSGPSHERWLISYADFITLLFAVFVVLFSSASSGKNTAREISDAVVEALSSGLLGRSNGHPRRASAADPAPPGAVPLGPSLKVLTEQLKQEILEKKVEIRMEPRGLVISLSQAAFFSSGQALVNPETHSITDRIASVVASLANSVRLEGHTDDVPISNSRYASNWELSAARSIAVLNLFVERYHIPRQRLSIAGFADTEPIGPNTSEEGRARNRRVDVVILNEMPGAPSAR